MLRDRWFLIGVLVIALSAGSAFALGTAIRRNTDRGAGPVPTPERRSAAPPAAPRPNVVPPSPTPGSRSPTRLPATPARPPADPRSVAGWQMLNTGRLRAAQEEFLQLLLTSPGHRDAMVGLVMVRRRLAGDDPAVLRRQAAAYQQAIARRTETEEHYTGEAMTLLAQANLIAAEEIEAERGKPQPPGAVPLSAATPKLTLVPPTPSPRGDAFPSRPRAQATPAPRPTRPRTATPAAQALPTPAAVTTAAPAPQTTTVEPPVDLAEPFLVVRIGPVPDAGRVSEIVGELTVSGYSAGVSRRDEPPSFQVVSEALARQAAERRAQVLAGYGFRSRLIARAGGLAQLEFGVFPSSEAAEAVASRIRTRGYHATVVREGGTGFMITAGPYRQTVANTIVRLIRARFGAGLAVTVSAAP